MDGLYRNFPPEPGEKPIEVVEKITDEIIYTAKGKGSKLSSGGMVTKLEAAMLAKEDNIPSVIINGERHEILYDLFENKAVCTVFV